MKNRCRPYKIVIKYDEDTYVINERTVNEKRLTEEEFEKFRKLMPNDFFLILKRDPAIGDVFDDECG